MAASAGGASPRDEASASGRVEKMTVTIKADRKNRLVKGRLFTDAPVICGSTPISVKQVRKGPDKKLAKVYVEDTYPEFKNRWQAAVRRAKGERVYAEVFSFDADAGTVDRCVGDRSGTVIAP